MTPRNLSYFDTKSTLPVYFTHRMKFSAAIFIALAIFAMVVLPIMASHFVRINLKLIRVSVHCLQCQGAEKSWTTWLCPRDQDI